MLTQNQSKIIRFLSSSTRDYSINEMSKICKITPNGTYKILKKMEENNIVKPKNIANIKSYKLNFEDEKTKKILEIALMPEKIDKKIRARINDFKQLEKETLACIIFGSYTDPKRKPNDLDVLFILEKKRYNKYKDLLNKIREITPIKIHDVVQTMEDFEKNIIIQDKIIKEALFRGIVFWGFETISEVIKNVNKRQIEKMY